MAHCLVFYEGQLYAECSDWDQELKAPNGAYLRFVTGNWYRTYDGDLDPINNWEIPEELKPVLLLLDIPWPKAFQP